MNRPGTWAVDEPEYGLRDLVETLKPFRIALLLVALVFAALAFVVSKVGRPVWEVTAVLMPAQVWTPGGGAQLSETPVRSVERLQSRELGDAALRRSGLSTSETDAEAVLFRRSLKAAPIPTSDLIRVTLRAHSPKTASDLLSHAVEEWDQSQRDTIAPTISRIRSDLQDATLQQTASGGELEALYKAREAEKSLPPSQRFAESVTLANTIAAKTAEIQSTKQRIHQLEEALSPARTHGVSYVGGIEVSPKPVSPRPARNAAIGGAAALVLAILGLVFREALRAPASERAAGASGPQSAESIQPPARTGR